MSEYMLFIWDDEQAWEHAEPQVVEATMAAHQAVHRRARASAARAGIGCTPVRRPRRCGPARTARSRCRTAPSPRPRR